MKLEIITPDKKLYDGKVKSAIFPGSEGSFGVLDDHAPFVSTLTAGTIQIIEDNNEKKEFVIKGGVAEIKHNTVMVLAD
ncbi:MAG: ATP synthase F1 subunit epsilon [Bacteroidia bacterium]|jgi:F-type H+-transporting ATPase subunit epsilon|nr:ATP synthase F1 subunit epsilon [Sphingobacteriaceae bacterium]MBP9070443.1 ATP synthase F1 subunit epsilon [Bacteroidia bacterium]